jgi:hypothetical protein
MIFCVSAMDNTCLTGLVSRRETALSLTPLLFSQFNLYLSFRSLYLGQDLV